VVPFYLGLLAEVRNRDGEGRTVDDQALRSGHLGLDFNPCASTATPYPLSIMKARSVAYGLFCAAAITCVVGCSHSDTVAEGVIFCVQYEQAGGKTEGYTRMNESRGVPGGNGSWNLDMHGRLNHDFPIITRPQHPDQGPQVIPVSRLVSVQFGDGGIKVVDEGKPNARN